MDDSYYTTGEKEFLLKIARQTLKRFVLTREKFEPQTVNKKLWEKKGVFITLSKNSKIKGYIGNVEPVESLILSIRNNSLAAVNNRGFYYLREGELDIIKIGISVLSELQRVNLKDIKYGDGVFVRRKDNSATYLPHVWKNFNNKDGFISSLCEKAGINSISFDNSEIEFLVYNVISFGE